MANLFNYDDRVAVITGAGGGLGKEYALFLASRGAKVVVNDLGTSFRGEGASRNAADLVVEEIVRNGGQAIANYDSVTNGGNIIKTAIDTWGRIDILVNNAGILRDISFGKMKEQDWDLVYDVHLKGSYKTTRAAWEYMANNKYGRIIMVASAAGLYGNFGQANYSSMKLALVGLSNTLAIEGAKYNIKVNTIAPLAGSRMTETIMPPELVRALRPSFVTPLVAYLVSETNQETGAIFEVGAGWISRVRWQRSKGFFDPNAIYPEAIRDAWAVINDWSEAVYPSSSTDSINTVVNYLSEKKPSNSIFKNSSSNAVDVTNVNNHKFAPNKILVTPRDVMLYALGIGENPNPSQSKALRFIYENHKHFQALPTMAVTYPSAMMNQIISIPGMHFNPMKLLHGEQYLIIHRPLPTNSELFNTGRVKGIYDKVSGALLVVEAETRDINGHLICTNEIKAFIRGSGGFGGPSGPIEDPHVVSSSTIPNRSPDKVERHETTPNLAHLYRLAGGDMNPLHIDPHMSAMGGFDRPILHGLCTMGIACRAVIKHYTNDDALAIKAMKVRFSKHVFPGDTLLIEMWQISPTLITLQVKVMGRNDVVLSNSFVELNSQLSVSPPVNSISPSLPPATSVASSDLVSAQIFSNIQNLLVQAGPSLMKSINGIYQFYVIDQSGHPHIWTLNLKYEPASLYTGEPKGYKADVTLEAKDMDFASIMTGKLDPQNAFLQNLLKIRGNITLATKLDQLIKQAKL